GFTIFQFAFIAFSSSTSTYTSSLAGDSCFANKFADASPQNKKKVSTFIDQIFSGGGTYYSTALTKAFAFFQSEPADLDRVILFMSDGAPSDSASVIMSTQIRGNERLNNSVIIMTYGLGSADFTVLTHMAQNNGAAYGITKTLGVPDAR
uniref:VWFA domain-containing protein n=1 Tax=Ciona savignyi TaxID=51511 RepID=H2Z2Q4_CIOSA